MLQKLILEKYQHIKSREAHINMIIRKSVVHFGSSMSWSANIAMGFEVWYNLLDFPGTDLSIHEDFLFRYQLVPYKQWSIGPLLKWLCLVACGRGVGIEHRQNRRRHMFIIFRELSTPGTPLTANSSLYAYNPPIITSLPPPSITIQALKLHHAYLQCMAQFISNPMPTDSGSLGQTTTTNV